MGKFLAMLYRWLWRVRVTRTVGVGGGGTIMCPAVSHLDPQLMFVSTDMSGLYRSEDGGGSWEVIDGRDMQGSTRCPVVFHPTQASTIFACAPYRGLRRSPDRGRTWDPPLVPDPGGGIGITAFAIDSTTGQPLVYGTEINGAFRWTGTTWQQCPTVAGDVVGIFIDTTPPGTWFIATRGTNGVFVSVNSGQTWAPFNGGLPSLDIRCLSGCEFPGGAAMYVTIGSAVATGKFEGGVYRSNRQSGGWSAWTPAMGTGIDTAIPATQDQYAPCPALAQYEWVVTARTAFGSVAYVTSCGTSAFPGARHSTVYKSYDQGGGWIPVYAFHHINATVAANVQGGWLDVDRGWSFGGPANVPDPRLSDPRGGGFAVCQSNPDIALFSNKAALYLTRSGGRRGCRDVDNPFAGNDWRAVYTRRADDGMLSWWAGWTPKPGQPYVSIGLEVTTAWHYVINPHVADIHYICYTDIAFARSDDGGVSWRYMPPSTRRAGQAKEWNTVYELAFDPDRPQRVWAAVSDQHDIPHEQQLAGPTKAGSVLFSDDRGLTWRDQSIGLPDAPVVSILIDQTLGVSQRDMWASIYGHGVYGWDYAATPARWVARNAGLGFAAGMNNNPPENKHTYRLHRHSGGRLFCTVTAKVVAGAPLDSGLFRSDDGGLSWTCITNAPHALTPLGLTRAVDFAVNPGDRDIIHICTAHVKGGLQGAVYRTVDGGVNWDAVLELEPQPGAPQPPHKILPRAYRDFVHGFAPILHPGDPNFVIVTTRTHGTWFSPNGVDQWQYYDVIPFMRTHRITFDPTPQLRAPRYISTLGAGVWKETTQLRTVVESGGLVLTPGGR